MFQYRSLSRRIAVIIATMLTGCTGGHGLAPRMPTFSHAQSARPISSYADRSLALTQSVRGHLYVADAAGVQRFPIVNGVLAAKSDLAYPGVGAPIIIDPLSHDLYVSHCCFIVAEYASGSTNPVRTLNIPGRITGLSVDPQGRLYVGIAAGLRCFRFGYCEFVTNEFLVYSRVASGNANPLQRVIVSESGCIQCALPLYRYYIALALDKQEELVASSHAPSASSGCNGVCIYASPATASHLVSTLSGPHITTNPSALAVDTSNELYVGNDPSGSSQPFVSAFHRRTNGNWSFDRETAVVGMKSIGNGIATAAGRLFVPDPLANVVYEVYSTRAGQQNPISRLSVVSPEDVQLGP